MEIGDSIFKPMCNFGRWMINGKINNSNTIDIVMVKVRRQLMDQVIISVNCWLW